MKIARSTKEYGGGSGYTTYESEWFRVVRWHHMGRGKKTTIEVKFHQHLKISFDGDIPFTTDEECMEQLTCQEIINALVHQKVLGYEVGAESKSAELRKCLGVK